MESERSNCCTGRKVTGQFAAFMGFVFGISLLAFILYVKIGLEINVIAVFAMFAAFMLATILWLYGCFKNKNELMMIALICWGVPLNLFLGYIFLFTIKNIPYGPDLNYPYNTAEIVIPSINVLFVMLYIILMMVYNSMGKYVENLIKVDWKLGGLIAGWVMIAFTVGETLLFLLQADLYFYGGLLLLAINSIAACSWLYGITKVKRGFMMVAVVAWSIPLAVWIGLIIYGVSEKGYNPGDRRHYNPIYSITMFYGGLFIIIASISRLNGVIQRNGPGRNEINVTYAPPPVINNKFNV